MELSLLFLMGLILNQFKSVSLYISVVYLSVFDKKPACVYRYTASFVFNTELLYVSIA